MIRVLVFTPEGIPQEYELPAGGAWETLKAMQDIVGGYVDCLAIDSNLDLWCNEMGSMGFGLPVNLSLGPRVPIRGTFLVARHDGRGNTVSLTDTDVAQLLAHYDRQRERVEGL